MLPVINGSQTEWQNLYTAIKEAEKLRQWDGVTGKQSFHLICSYKSKQYVHNKNLALVMISYFKWESCMWFFMHSKFLGSSLMAVDWAKQSLKQVRCTKLGFVIYDINWSTINMSKFPIKIT